MSSSDSSSESEPDKDLQADLLNLRKVLGVAYQTLGGESEPTSRRSSPAAKGKPESADAPYDEVELLTAQRDATMAAIEANEAMCNQLQLVKEQIELFLHENANQAFSISQLRTNPSAGKGENPESVGRMEIGPSRFWVQGSHVPKYNAETTALLPYYKYLPHRFDHPRNWSPQASAELREHVLLVFKNIEYEAANEAGQAPSATSADWNARMARIDALTLASEGVLDKINGWNDNFWQLKVTPKNGIDGNENRIFWHNYCCPTISHAPWTEAEEEQLVDLANENQRRNWEQVANDLGSGRTPIACMMHYKLIERRTLGQGRFTADEEQRLLEGMKMHGKNWPEVAAHVGGHRTRQQVASHWRDHMTPKRKGKWSEEEDQLLIQALSVVGDRKHCKWSRIAAVVKTRSQVQCRERWCNVLDPELKAGEPWTDEEIATLTEMAAKKKKEDGSIPWAAVAAELPGRTDNDVTRQYLKLKAQEESRRTPRKRPRGNSDNQEADPGAAAADGASASSPKDPDATATAAATAGGSAPQSSDVPATAATMQTAGGAAAKQQGAAATAAATAAAKGKASMSQPKAPQAPIYISPETLQQHARGSLLTDPNGKAAEKVNSTDPSAE